MTASDNLFQQAQQHIPGGVNSPVHAFKGVGGNSDEDIAKTVEVAAKVFASIAES